MSISQEELAIHDHQVVCPQCLAVCRYHDGALSVRDTSEQPARRSPGRSTSIQEATRYCHSCGKQLPRGIKFCPYCGADLMAPFIATQAEPAATATVGTVEPQPAKKGKPATIEPQPKPATGQSGNKVEDKLRTIPHRYNRAGIHLHQNGTMPSKTFKTVAYLVIALLLLLLVGIIIAGNMIEPAA